MRVALIQHSVAEDKKSNLEKVVELVESAKVQGARVVCLQELFSMPYFPQEESKSYFKFAEKISGQTGEALSKIAKKNNIILIGGSVFEKDNSKYYNTTPVFGQNGDLIGKYRKIHTPNDPHYWEKRYFSKSREGYSVVETEFGKIGFAICYDQWYPEVARILALKGAQIIFYPTAIGWTEAMKQSPEECFADKNWIDVQRVHGIVNHVFIAAVNRCGKEKYIDFWGQSFISDPFGSFIAKAEVGEKDKIIIGDCDLGLIDKAKSWGFLQNRRPDTYGGITKI